MAWLTRLSWLLGGKDIEANIVIVGLNGSGKSTVMRQLKPHEVRFTHNRLLSIKIGNFGDLSPLCFCREACEIILFLLNLHFP